MSTDGGDTWTLTSNNNDVRQRAWYYSKIFVDPKNENRVYCPNVNFMRSNDVGRLRRVRAVCGVALCLAGFAAMVSGVAFKATMVGGFPLLSVFGYVTAWGGSVQVVDARPADRFRGDEVAGGRLEDSSTALSSNNGELDTSKTTRVPRSASRGGRRGTFQVSYPRHAWVRSAAGPGQP